MTDELDPFTAAKSYLIRALSKRMLSEAELRQRLKRREHTQKTIDAALDWARDLRLIDDDAVSEASAREAQRTCRGGLSRSATTASRPEVSQRMRRRVLPSSLAR